MSDGRRLPIYIVVDVSGSMSGQPIQTVKNNLESLCDELAQDRRLSESAYLSVITYSTQAEQLIDLRSATTGDFSALNNLPDMAARGGMTATGDALKKVCECVNRELIPAHTAHTGDYKPILVLLTDGQSNVGSLSDGIEAIHKIHWGRVIIAGAGDDVSEEELLSIKGTDKRDKEIYLTVRIEDTSANSMAAFFEMVSQSIRRESEVAQTGQTSTDDPVMEVLNDPDSGVTEISDPTADSWSDPGVAPVDM